MRQSAFALAVTALAGFAIHAHAQTIHVGGENILGTSILNTSSGISFVPNVGGRWAASSGANVSYSRLTSRTLTVPTTGTVSLSFDHRYFFEYDWDGGAVYVSVNGGSPKYVPLDALNGYVRVLKSSSEQYRGQFGPFPDFESVFTGQSAGWSTPAYITSTATLGPFNAGDTIAFEFRAGWDWYYSWGLLNWEINKVQVRDSTSTDILNAEFITSGASGFTVTSDAGVTGPWAYTGTSINQFEINANNQTADCYVPSSPGIINLNSAKLKVVLRSGEFAAGKTFTLFDLSGGSTLEGSYSSIELPLPMVQWDLSGLQPGGNGKIIALSGPAWTYTWNNTTPGTYDWQTANWNISPSTPASTTAWPEGMESVAYLNPPSGSNTWTMTANSTTLGELHFGAVSGAQQTINGLGKTLVFDNGYFNAEITRGDVSTQIEAFMNFGVITLNSDLDINITSHITSGLTINAPIGGTGGLNVYNIVGDDLWPGLQLVGTHTYQGGTTVTNGTLTLPSGSSIINGISMTNGTLRLGYNESIKSQANILGGAIKGSGTVMTDGNFTFNNDENSWTGTIYAFGNFPAPIQFTSIGNIGETITVGAVQVPRPTALGSPATVAQGTILAKGGSPTFEYIGSGDTTDRVIEYAGFDDSDSGLSVMASGTTTPQNPFIITSNLAGTVMGRMIMDGTGAGEWAGNIGTTANRLQKLGSGTWILSGNNSYPGTTDVNKGTLILAGASTGGGLVTVANAARLGGNGSTSSAVQVNAGGKLLVEIPDWSGSAGTGFSDLQATSLNLAGAWTLDINSATSYANFVDISKSFTFLVTTGGITGFNPTKVTIVKGNGFTGVGTWSVQQIGNTLKLVYTSPLTATTTSLDSTLNPSVEGQQVTFTATVMVGASTATTATGTIKFKVDNAVVAEAAIIGGKATYTTSILAVGSNVIMAIYSGNGTYTGSTGSLPQTVSVAPYTTWAAKYNADLSDRAADYDGDGLSNFQEFAFGLNPTSAASVNPITDISKLNSLNSFSYNRYVASGLTYSYWFSADLLHWRVFGTSDEEPGEPNPDSGAQTVVVIFNLDSADLPTGGKFFIRVQAN